MHSRPCSAAKPCCFVLTVLVRPLCVEAHERWEGRGSDKPRILQHITGQQQQGVQPNMHWHNTAYICRHTTYLVDGAVVDIHEGSRGKLALCDCSHQQTAAAKTHLYKDKSIRPNAWLQAWVSTSSVAPALQPLCGAGGKQTNNRL